ncbi:hypothetical protein [Nocardia fluminea]|uniref:hypothetical protein n=1 Tax=Nocardia fluminea TaxID=134984 RepID=UPI00365DC703
MEPYHVVDSRNVCWNTQGSGNYRSFDPDAHEQAMTTATLAEIAAEHSPLRPVLLYTDAEIAELEAAFDSAGRKAVASTASAVDEVHDEACHRHRSWDFGYAERTLTGADDPSVWDPRALMWLRHTGAWLNRRPHPSDPPRSNSGPKPLRVDLDAREQIATVLRAWTAPERGVPVAESLTRIVSRYADETHGPDSWRRIADQWMPLVSARPSWGPECHRVLMARSIYLTPLDDTADQTPISGGRP